MTTPRLMSGAEAAAYLGLQPPTFSQWVAAGRVPKPLPGTRRWDRVALDQALDKLSGIASSIAPADVDPFAAWEAKYEAREAAARAGNRQ